VKVLIHLATHGRAQLNVAHMQYTTAGPLNPNIADTMFTAFKNALTGANAEAQWASTFSVTGMGVIDLRSAANPELPSTTAALVGTGTGNALPDQVSIVVTARTALTGRSHRGRIYTFGYIQAACMADGTISDAAAAAAVAYGNALYTACTAGGGVLAINSPALPERPSKPGGTLPAKNHEITPVTGLFVRDRVFDTNRRRLDTLKR
jgi:hypothetical protein